MKEDTVNTEILYKDENQNKIIIAIGHGNDSWTFYETDVDRSGHYDIEGGKFIENIFDYIEDNQIDIHHLNKKVLLKREDYDKSK